jgi:hypothetical protein
MNKVEKQILKIEDDLLSHQGSVKRSMYGCVFLGLIALLSLGMMRDSENENMLHIFFGQLGLCIGGYYWYRAKSRHIDSIKYYRDMRKSRDEQGVRE